MAHLTVHRAVHGTKHGTQHNGGLILGDPLAGVTRDATSGIYLPSTAGEWTTLKSVRGFAMPVPHHLWLMQEPSGNVTDQIGGGLGVRSLTATTAGNAPIYQKVIPGWTRRAIGGPGAAVNSSLSNSTMVNTATESYIVLVVARSAAAAILRTITSYGTPLISQPVSNKVRLRAGASSVDSINDHAGTVHPFVFAVNHPATSIKLFSELEKMNVVYSVPAGSALTFQCAATTDATAADFLYACAWDSTTATDAEIKALLEAIGYTIPWS